MLGNLLLICLLSLLLGPFFSLGVGDINIYPFDVLITLTSSVFFLSILKHKLFRVNLTLILFSFFSFFSFFITIFMVESSLLLGSLLYLFRFLTYFLFTYFVYLLVRSNFIEKKEILRILKISFFSLISLNLIQYIFFRDISFMSGRGFDPHTSRLTGFFLDPNFLGIFIVIFYFVNSQFLKNIYFEYISIFMVLLTQSRSALLSLVICILFLNIKNLKKLVFNLLFVGIFLIFNSTFIDRFTHANASNDSSYLRIDSWKNALYLNSFSDLFGVGFNNYRNSLISQNLISPEFYFSNSSTYSDSSLLSILAMTGFFGLFLYILFVFSFVRSYEAAVLLAVMFFNSTIINSLFFPSVIVFLYLSFFYKLHYK